MGPGAPGRESDEKICEFGRRPNGFDPGLTAQSRSADEVEPCGAGPPGPSHTVASPAVLSGDGGASMDALGASVVRPARAAQRATHPAIPSTYCVWTISSVMR